MKLKSLKSRLNGMSGSALQTLSTAVGGPRPSGRKWMETRKRIAASHGFRCRACNRVWTPRRDQIDHDVPLEQGGSGDDSNLQPLCNECHASKTKAEATQRASRIR